MKTVYDHLEIREVFHLEFLRRFSAKADPKAYALKGGVNLRLFFRSIRYSEDMDLDAFGLDVSRLRDFVVSILRSPSFADSLEPFGIAGIRPPDLVRAKQTETTQRFKVHLLTDAGIDLFTKIEFSRRGRKGTVAVDLVPEAITRVYGSPPLWVPHYDLSTAILQKIEALALRREVQARDIFDIFILSGQAGSGGTDIPTVGRSVLGKAMERIFEADYVLFRDTVLAYLTPEGRRPYEREETWDDIRTRVTEFLDGLEGNHAEK